MEWTTFWAAFLGGAVSIVTALLTNGFQFARERAGRDEERKRDQAEYERRQLEQTHERVRAEVGTIVEAVAKSEAMHALVFNRNGNEHTTEPLRHLVDDEIDERSAWIARASASSRALRLVDNRLGGAAQDVVEDLKEIGPGEEPLAWDSEHNVPRLESRLTYLIDQTREYLAPAKAVEGKS